MGPGRHLNNNIVCLHDMYCCKRLRFSTMLFCCAVEKFLFPPFLGRNHKFFKRLIELLVSHNDKPGTQLLTKLRGFAGYWAKATYTCHTWWQCLQQWLAAAQNLQSRKPS